MIESGDGTPKPTRLLGAVPSTTYERLIVRYPYQSDGDQAIAYHGAALRLAQSYRGQPVDDTMLLPFLMLFRQAFELELKELIRFLAAKRRTYYDAASVPTGRELDELLRSNKVGHNLHRLMNLAKSHWGAFEMPEAFPPVVEQVVLKIHDADPFGTAFRYAGGLPDVQENADFPNLVKSLDEAYEMLEAAYSYADALFDAMPDPSEFGPDPGDYGPSPSDYY